MQEIYIVNAKVITPSGIIENGGIRIKGGVIEEVFEGQAPHNGNIVDATGLYLSPGFVELHIHGGGGADFMDATPQAYAEAVNAHARHGTTSLYPTVLGSSFEEIIKSIEAYKKAKESGRINANMLGIHLEGPYVAKSQAGALPVKYIRNPDPKEYSEIFAAAEGNISRWSFAPELDGADRLCDFLTERGILPSIAHSEADYDMAKAAFARGFTLITHLYSAMSTIKRVNGFRVAGLVESAYLIDEMDVEIIADGCHLPESLLNYVCKFKDKSRIALVTDAMRASCQVVSSSFLGSREEGIPCIIEDGVAKLPDRSAFAGSIATADRLIRTMVKKAGVPLHDAVSMMTANPVRMMGDRVKKGRIEKGFDADLVLFDEDITVKEVFVGGKQIE